MPSSSLFLRLSTTLVSAASLALAVPQSLGTRQSAYTYALDKEFSGSSFFDQFTFYDQADPTHGFVTYVNKKTAQDAGLAKWDGEYAVMGIESETELKDWNIDHYYNKNGVGRQSVRIETNDYLFTRGLVITDIKQMPGGICGTWPAFWTLGPNWPYNGEIDIIEGANDQSGNWMALHTGNPLSIMSPAPGSTSGYVSSSDCNVYTDKNNPNYTGCKYVDNDAKSFGTQYTGGVWAMQWTAESIRVWFWPYGSVPNDVSSGSPKPGSASWGKPRSDFTPGANQKINDNFKNHKLIFDTTFCGDLGDAVWASCGKKYPQYSSCAEYVAKNPTHFADAKWKVKYVKVYKETTGTTSTSTTVSTSTAATSTSTSAAVSTSTAATSSAAATTTTSTSAAASTSSAAATTTASTSAAASTSSAAATTTASTSAAASTSSAAATTTASTSAAASTSSAAATTTASTSAAASTSSAAATTTTTTAAATTSTSAASTAYSTTGGASSSDASATSRTYVLTTSTTAAYSTTTGFTYVVSTSTTAAYSTSVSVSYGTSSATSTHSGMTYNAYATSTASSSTRPPCRRARPTY